MEICCALLRARSSEGIINGTGKENEGNMNIFSFNIGPNSTIMTNVNSFLVINKRYIHILLFAVAHTYKMSKFLLYAQI